MNVITKRVKQILCCAFLFFYWVTSLYILHDIGVLAAPVIKPNNTVVSHSVYILINTSRFIILDWMHGVTFLKCCTVNHVEDTCQVDYRKEYAILSHPFIQTYQVAGCLSREYRDPSVMSPDAPRHSYPSATIPTSTVNLISLQYYLVLPTVNLFYNVLIGWRSPPENVHYLKIYSELLPMLQKIQISRHPTLWSYANKYEKIILFAPGRFYIKKTLLNSIISHLLYNLKV